MVKKTSSRRMPIKRSAAALPPEVTDLIKRIRAIAAEVPGFQQLPPAKMRSLTANAHLHDSFLHAVSNAMDSSPNLQTAVGSLSPDQLREAVDFSNRYSAVAEELLAIARGIRATIALKRSGVARAALQAYAIAGRMANLPEHEVLISHVGEMKRAMGRSGVSRKPKPPVTER